MNYKIIDKDKYYRKDIFLHFTQDCKCSVSVTHRIDVTELADKSKRSGTKFYINFLYLLSKVLNSREDYRMQNFYETGETVLFDKINPAHYIFHEDTETFTTVYSEYSEDYQIFYKECEKDIKKAKETREYGLDFQNHKNWFDASYLPWISYDSLNIELPDGYFHFLPIINWRSYKKENGKILMPLTVRLNHAAADGYLISKVFTILEDEIQKLREKI